VAIDADLHDTHPGQYRPSYDEGTASCEPEALLPPVLLVPTASSSPASSVPAFTFDPTVLAAIAQLQSEMGPTDTTPSTGP
jgi:hypothetical protein